MNPEDQETQYAINESIQTELANKRYYTGAIDGEIGPLTRGAIVAFKTQLGWMARPYPLIETLPELFSPDAPSMPTPKKVSGDPPWLIEILKHLGKHENRDNVSLRRWLASDGKTLGDPAQYPWCGDAVQTALALTVPEEPLPTNPYLAQAWKKFGRKCPIVRGAVCVFWRGNPKSIYGHVGFVAGEDSEAIHVIGGNQSNAITSDARISKSRLIGTYWPINYPMIGEHVELQAGGELSTNEA